MKQYILYSLMVLMMLLISIGCEPQQKPATPPEVKKLPPADIPKGILVNEIPPNADIIFTSVRYVLSKKTCMTDDFEIKDNFITNPECNRTIYTDGKLAIQRQLFTMDMETGEVVQLTNNDCFFITAQVVDATTIMTLAACSDTDNNGRIDEHDEKELFLLDLTTQKMDCLTDDFDFSAVNNPDYSPVHNKIIFSAQRDGVFHNYLFTIDAKKNLVQITDDDNYMDFDCAWSQDGSKIVFNRLPLPIFSKPSQVWLMDSTGSGVEKITEGGPDPGNEEKHGQFPIGTDADPDMSPDNRKVVFSRLKTGTQNAFFGVWELIIIDVITGKEEILDSQYANMIPEWKSGGIIFVRQQSVPDYLSQPMDIKQSLYRYQDGQFTELEKYPYNVFPIGAFGGSWIE
jgi:Tol biopolymer transport system component